MKLKVMQIVRYSAQLIGFHLSLFFLFFLIGEGVSVFLEGKFNSFILVLLMLASIVGFIMALKKPKNGAFLMIASSIATGLYLIVIAGFIEWKMSLIFAIPFLVTGLLFYLSSDLEKLKTESKK